VSSWWRSSAPSSRRATSTPSPRNAATLTNDRATARTAHDQLLAISGTTPLGVSRVDASGDTIRVRTTLAPRQGRTVLRLAWNDHACAIDGRDLGSG
jgi:hypothetical protein